MVTEKLDYVTFINDIKAKVAALQALLVSVESAAALGALGQAIDGGDLSLSQAAASGDSGIPIDLPEGAFNGKSVPASVELYLSAAKKKKTNKEIAAALREGGVESNASNFENVVTGALFGLKKAGKVLRFKDGWGLAEWYPAHIRAVTPAGSVKRGKKKGRKSTPKDKTNKTAPVTSQRANDRAQTISPSLVPPKKANERALEYLQTKPEAEHSLADVAKHIGMGTFGARLILGKLVKAGKVRMSAPGMYMIGRPQLVSAS